MNPVKGIDLAFWYILGFSVVLLVGITTVMIAFTIIYRRSRNPEPADIRGNWKLEVIWTVIPTLIALSMFAVGWSSYTGLRTVPAGALEIAGDGPAILLAVRLSGWQGVRGRVGCTRRQTG